MSHEGQSAGVQVVYDGSDFRALYRACRRCKRNALILLVGLPVFFGLLSYKDGARGIDLIVAAIPYFLIAGGVILGIYVIGPWNAIRVRRKYGWGEPMSVSLTDQGVSTQHPNQTSLFYWSKIRDVVVRQHRLFFFTTPACAIILPRRCFASDEQFSRWAEYSERLWREARATVE